MASRSLWVCLLSFALLLRTYSPFVSLLCFVPPPSTAFCVHQSFHGTSASSARWKYQEEKKIGSIRESNKCNEVFESIHIWWTRKEIILFGIFMRGKKSDFSNFFWSFRLREKKKNSKMYILKSCNYSSLFFSRQKLSSSISSKFFACLCFPNKVVFFWKNIFFFFFPYLSKERNAMNLCCCKMQMTLNGIVCDSTATTTARLAVCHFSAVQLCFPTIRVFTKIVVVWSLWTSNSLNAHSAFYSGVMICLKCIYSSHSHSHHSQIRWNLLLHLILLFGPQQLNCFIIIH